MPRPRASVHVWNAAGAPFGHLAAYFYVLAEYEGIEANLMCHLFGRKGRRDLPAAVTKEREILLGLTPLQYQQVMRALDGGTVEMDSKFTLGPNEQSGRICVPNQDLELVRKEPSEKTLIQFTLLGKWRPRIFFFVKEGDLPAKRVRRWHWFYWFARFRFPRKLAPYEAPGGSDWLAEKNR